MEQVWLLPNGDLIIIIPGTVEYESSAAYMEAFGNDIDNIFKEYAELLGEL